METERSRLSPTRERSNDDGGSGGDGGEGDPRVANALVLLRGFDPSARVEAVVRTVDTTLVRMAPGSRSSASVQIAALAALRVAFPFSAATAIENSVTGETQIHLLLSSNDDAVRHAKEFYANTMPFRALDRLSNALLAAAALTFASLLQASLTRE